MVIMSNLYDLNFSDIFINQKNEQSTYKKDSDSVELYNIPASFYEELDSLRAGLINDSLEYRGDSVVKIKQKFNFRWNSVPLRVARLETVDGPVFVCRHWGSLKTLVELGFGTRLTPYLLSPKIRNGLFIFMGKAGSGKSTAAAATMIERLQTIGGAAWTLECPVERPLHGQHNKGFCYQMEVESDHDFGDGIKQVVRASPNILLIGEIRTPEAANEAIFAAAAGMLVITTYHASDLLIGLSRFAKQCGEKEIFSSVLCGALYLNLESGKEIKKSLPGYERLPGKQVIPDKILQVDPLMLTGPPEKVDPIRSILRSDNIGTLSSVIHAQREAFIMNRDI